MVAALRSQYEHAADTSEHYAQTPLRTPYGEPGAHTRASRQWHVLRDVVARERRRRERLAKLESTIAAHEHGEASLDFLEQELGGLDDSVRCRGRDRCSGGGRARGAFAAHALPLT